MKMILHAPNRMLYFSVGFVSCNVIYILGRLGHSEEMIKRIRSKRPGLQH